MIAATTSGNHPSTPSSCWRNERQINDDEQSGGDQADPRLQRQISRIARNINIDVNSMVIETAMPNAAARLSDERKAT